MKFTVENLSTFKFSIKDGDSETVFEANYPTTKQMFSLQESAQELTESASSKTLDAVMDNISGFMVEPEKFKSVAGKLSNATLVILLQKLISEFNGEA